MTSTTIRTSRTHLGAKTPASTSTTSCTTVSIKFTQRPTTEMETPEHKTLNNTLVNSLNQDMEIKPRPCPLHT